MPMPRILYPSLGGRRETEYLNNGRIFHPSSFRLHPFWVLALLVVLLVVGGCATRRAERLEAENRHDIPSICPVRCKEVVISSRFGVRKDPFTGQMRQHNAVDFVAPMGTPVVATADGVVVYAGREGGYGRIVKINHGCGIETWYGHLRAIRVKMGKWVRRGDRIGKLGKSGRTTGPNLHYEVRINGKPVNPAKYLP